MSSLYQRATPAQALILRMVEGAVKNTTDAHPHLKISPRYRRSIAKRAAGTLSAQWPEVLAATPSAKADAFPLHEDARPAVSKVHAAGRGGADHTRLSPLGRLAAAVRKEIGAAKRTLNVERLSTLIDVHRMISALQREDAA